MTSAKAQSASAFETAEYFSSNFLAPINASTAYAAGFTGNGSLIAIIDNGFLSAHVDLAPNLSLLDTANVELHGTHVAGIAAGAKNGIGSHGVAYNAGLILGTYLGLQDPASFLTAAENGATVISNSWGIDVDVNAVLAQPNVDADPAAALNAVLGSGSAYWQSHLDALDVAQASSVITWAATNDTAFTDIDVSAGMPLVDARLAEAWITVVNVNPGDAVTYTQYGGATISHSAGELVSGPCGSAMMFCMAAPGVQANSAISTGINDFGVLYGTSMATPMIAGAVAIASEMFPDATPAQLAQLVLQTSTDIGARGVDDQFGWGFLNLANLTAVADPSAAQTGPMTQALQISTLNAFMNVMKTQMGIPGASGSGIEALGFAQREGSPLEDIFPIREEFTRRAWLSPMGEYLHVDDGARWNGY
ncbi:MAG: S8 family peptidase [Sulfitobacter sp.]